ncbi:MAG: TIGR02594 family protein, partial [Aureispira sp.]|nr:TIGR02594 family protein [Aureispira sp.]
NTDEKPTDSSGISDSVGKKGENKKADVQLVQNLLKEKINAPLKGSGICGPKTIKYIKEFQAKVGISETGLVAPNDDTWKKLNESSSSETSDTKPSDNKDLSIKKSVGKKGENDKEDVKIVQKLLRDKGAKLVGLGICGPLTVRAIKKFQEINMNGFSDGLVEPKGRTFKLLIGSGKSINSDDDDNTGGGGGPLEKPNWISIAEGEKGVKENTSKTKHDPRVMEYHASVKGNINTDETPWCSSFVNWVMNKAGKGGTNSAMAISWKKYGKKLDRPAYGSIAVIDWDGPGPGWKGHVGFVVGKKGNNILLLGGNQANAVNIKTFSTSKIVAYVVPNGYDVPDSAYSFGKTDGDYGSGGDVSSTR